MDNPSQNHIEEFNRSKIYEKLNYTPEPPGYTGKLSWTVQQQIAATNGIQYVDRVGKLKDYPEYGLPVEKTEKGLMLAIGTGWGRWLVAGCNKGYIPVGIDIRLEFCQTALTTLAAHGKNGYTVVADLKELPFKDNIFDLVWSFSVIQHTHKKRMISCLKHIKRILSNNGHTMLEFPNKYGIRNYFGNVRKKLNEANDYNSWIVRYYSVKEYKQLFLDIFNNFHFTVHSALGIGILKEDLKYVSFKNKILCSFSLLLSAILKIIKPFKVFADSIYIYAKKEDQKTDEKSKSLFLADHNTDPTNNLNIVHLLRCPISGSSLIISEDKRYLISMGANFKYPIINNIPVLIKSEAMRAQ